MAIGDDEQGYAQRAAHELDRAAAATDLATKVLHLNMAARYATLRERSVAPHGLVAAPVA